MWSVSGACAGTQVLPSMSFTGQDPRVDAWDDQDGMQRYDDTDYLTLCLYPIPAEGRVSSSEALRSSEEVELREH